ncbi:UNVERIFIED_CONTAM: hypothetical protein Sradi_6486800 [Sesamum radiatum]|uniref:Uncharacterized protein n=1 Tax=Sesamum radiatum TaxID=300843 RepID=A0AAW2JX77_SESRA
MDFKNSGPVPPASDAKPRSADWLRRIPVEFAGMGKSSVKLKESTCVGVKV